MLISEMEAQLKHLRETLGDLPLVYPNRTYCEYCGSDDLIWEDVRSLDAINLVDEEDGKLKMYAHIDCVEDDNVKQ